MRAASGVDDLQTDGVPVRITGLAPIAAGGVS
jgi:hypothetical protein